MRLILTAGVLALGLTACGAASHSAPPQTTSATAVSPSSAAAGTASAAATPAGATPVSTTSRAARTSTPAPSPMPIADWCSGTGYHRWQAATKDLTALQSSSANAAKLALTGRQLAQDAAAAAAYPPPGVSATAYKQGMQDLAAAGSDYQQGELSRANTLVGEATNYLDNINSYVGVKCP